jgi:hypothetical protein
MKFRKERIMLSSSLQRLFSSRRVFSRSLAVASLCLGTLAAPLAASAQESGPFGVFAGSYRGGGVVVGTDGHKERISCRAGGEVTGGGRSLSESMVCASDSYRFDIRTRAVAEGGAVRGDWQETTRGVTGDFTGKVSSGQFSGSVEGGSFSAAFLLRVSGRRLTFLLRPQGADVASVEVALSR